MAVQPIDRLAAPLLELRPFQRDCAARVASWVRDDNELFELAPRSVPPLTAEKVRAWQLPGRRGLSLCERGRADPIGYGELNVLNSVEREYWLGHIIIDPARRGIGFGLEFVRLLVQTAFSEHRARTVSLVVVPTNSAAISCYRAAGLHDVARESHYFAGRRRRCRLLRMSVTRDEYAFLDEADSFGD